MKKWLLFWILVFLFAVFCFKAKDSLDSSAEKKEYKAKIQPVPKSVKQNPGLVQNPQKTVHSIKRSTGKVALNSKAKSKKPPIFELLSSTGSKTRFRFRLPEFQQITEKRKNKTMTRILCSGGGSILRRGAPALPVYAVNIAVLPNKKYHMRVLNPVWEERLLTDPPIPSNGPILRTDPILDATPDPAIYNGTKAYPEKTSQLTEMGKLRGVGSVRVNIFPMQYLPDQKELRICRSVDVVVECEEENLELPEVDQNSEFAALQCSTYLNGEELRGDSCADVGTLLILYPSGWTDSVAEFVSWKKQIGWTVLETEYSPEDYSDSSALKDFIKKRYTSDAVTHVLLLGDSENIPPYQEYSEKIGPEMDKIATDVPYSLLDEETTDADFYPDVFLSRITSNTATELQAVLEKMRLAEKADDVDSDEWREYGVFMASNESGSTNIKDREYMELERQELLEAAAYSDVTTLYDSDDNDVSAADVSEVLNEGRTYFAYLGHGSKTSFETSDFNTDNVDALTNAKSLPLLLTPVCLNGYFTDGDCLAEHFLENLNGGAVAVMASTASTYWMPPIRMIQKMTDLILAADSPSDDGRLATLGAWNYNAVQAGMDYYAEDSTDIDVNMEQNYKLFFLYEMHLFGDCSQVPRVRSLHQLQVTYDQSEDLISGTVRFADTQTAVQNAAVCLLMENDQQQSMRTNQDGQFSFSCQSYSGISRLQVLDGSAVFWSAELRKSVTVRYGSGSGFFAVGDSVKVEAEALDDDRTFLYWRTVGMTLSIENARQSSLTFVMPEKNVELTAVFVKEL